MGISVKDLIREKEAAASVAYQSFVLLINRDPKALFCFFENKDAPYYHLRIKSTLKNSYHYIPCGGKSMVKKVYTIIKRYKEYRKYKIAFFIDRDFDESIKNKFSEIYETPCYSIENLYCGISTIKELIKTDFQIGEDNQCHDTILELYRNLQEDFLKKSLLFNSWYKFQKIKSKELKIDSNVSLSNSLIPAFVEVSLDGVTPKYTLQTIREKYPQSIPCLESELNEIQDGLIAMDLRLSLRGKYLFTFMTYFIRKLIEDGANKQSVMTKKVKYNMDSSLALTSLTTYAETPNCLIDFLEKYN